ncbi:MAG: hypothetical protein AAGI30_00635 [Planctomycetota bacterium]
MGEDHDAVLHSIRSIARRLTIRDAAIRGVLWGGVGLLAGATAVLAARLGLGLGGHEVLWLLPVGGAGGAIIGVVVAWRARVRPETLVPLLDDASSAGGLLMSSGSRGASAWRGGSIAALMLPRIRWAWWRPVATLATASAVSLVAAIANPALHEQDRSIDLSAHIEAMHADIEALEQAEVVDSEEAETLESELEGIDSRADATNPSAAWEALDELSRQMEARATMAAAEFAETSEAAEALAEASMEAAEAAEQLTPESATSLAEALAQAGADAKPLAEDAGVQEAVESLAQAADAGDPQAVAEALEQLSQAASRCSGGASDRLATLTRAGLGNSPGQRGSNSARDKALAELKAMLDDAKQGKPIDAKKLAMCAGQCMNPGVSRGPGAAKLAWRDEPTSWEDAAFRPEAIESQDPDLDGSALLGTSLVDPGEQQPGAVSAGDGLVADTSASSTAAVAQVLPKHRDAVRRYFTRSDQVDPAPLDDATSQAGEEGAAP